jgi:signal transduction histidine kinase
MQNTIKHSSGTQFILQVKISDNLMISTSDNGIGISDTKTSKGNGLTNIRHRINELGGTLTVSNENGTHYKLTLPLTQELISTTHVHKNRNN